MMASILLADFGASRIKCALWSHDTQMITAVRECAAPSLQQGSYGEVEVDPEAYWRALVATAGELLHVAGRVDALWLCTEMHGIVIGSAKDGLPYTRYISWQDERSRRSLCGTASIFDRLNYHGGRFFEATGMQLRPGLPLLTLAYLQYAGQLPPDPYLFTLADWLLWRGGESDPAIHSSLAAGTGLFDVQTGSWSEQLIELAGLSLSAVRLSRIVPVGNRIGCINLVGYQIDVYGGLGDLQAAAYGVGFPTMAPLMVNLGTGSQVLVNAECIPANAEFRPDADGGWFSAITHIPSGRALNVFASFCDQCAVIGGGRPFFWGQFVDLTVDAIMSAKADIDLNVFDAAWRYQQGGTINAIHEGYFSVDTLLATLARSWLEQYVLAMNLIDPMNLRSSFLLAGGLSRRCDFILPVLERLSDRRGVIVTSCTGEETLDGLLMLALRQTYN